MKKTFFILSAVLALFFTSCTSSVQYLSSEYISIFDYWYLQQRDIFVSESNSVNFAYESIGSVVIEVRSGGTQTVNMINGRESGQDLSTIQQKAREEVIMRLYDELKSLGANGIINVKVDVLPPVPAGKNIYSGPGYSITGMAIKK